MALIENCSKSYLIIARALWGRHYYYPLIRGGMEMWNDLHKVPQPGRDGARRRDSGVHTLGTTSLYHAQDSTELQVRPGCLKSLPSRLYPRPLLTAPIHFRTQGTCALASAPNHTSLCAALTVLTYPISWVSTGDHSSLGIFSEVQNCPSEKCSLACTVCVSVCVRERLK